MDVDEFIGHFQSLVAPAHAAVAQLDSLAIMRGALIITALLLCGCGPSNRQTESSVIAQPTILDEVLAKPEYAEAIKQAESDLPADERRDKPWPINDSRSRRESSVAQKMLAEIQPRLERMSVTELIRSLKVTPRLSGASFEGVSADVYSGGNRMIIAEIQSRPKYELAVLPSLADASVDVWEGIQGPGATLAELIHYRILHDK